MFYQSMYVKLLCVCVGGGYMQQQARASVLCTKLRVASSGISPGSDLSRSCSARCVGQKVHVMSFHVVCMYPLVKWPTVTHGV